MQNHLRFLIVDDYQLAREALREMVTAHPDWQVVHLAENGQEAIESVALHKPDIVLMDVAMPKMNGLEATYRIKTLFPTILIILFSAYADDGFRQGSIDVGADFFIQKEKLTADVLKEIMNN
ncbi:MAG: response regulator transcription factor, partial [Anaerolineales bacterium]|nr:response regulator transcription factor [Anaerolineales bacterium]